MLEQLADRCGRLYSLPAVAAQVLELTDAPTVDVRALKQCIENDPALAAKILRTVNSSLFGLSREVCDLNQALALLGTNPLKLLVLGFSLPEGLLSGIDGEALRRYWHRTLVKAVAARELCQSFWRQNGDEAFLAGLLQDVGELALLQEVGGAYYRFLDTALSSSLDVSEAEQQAMQFDHRQLSARLLERWNLPRTLVQAVGAGRDPARWAALPPPTRTAAQILHLSDLLAMLLAENRADVLACLLDAGQAYRGLMAGDFAVLVENLQQRVQGLAEILSLQLPIGGNYDALLAAAHGKLADAAAEAAVQLLANQTRHEGETLLAEAQALTAAVQQIAGGHKPLPRFEVPSSKSENGSEMPTRATHPLSAGTSQKVATRSLAPTDAGKRTRYSVAMSAAGDSIDPGFLGRLQGAAAACRQARSPLSLLLISIDAFDEVVLRCGASGAEELVTAMQGWCKALDCGGSNVIRLHDAELAMIAPGCDRQGGVGLANQLVRNAAQWAGERRPGGGMLTLSIGLASVALVPKNFPVADLITSAGRCLSAAQMSGGGAIKSIEIF